MLQVNFQTDKCPILDKTFIMRTVGFLTLQCRKSLDNVTYWTVELSAFLFLIDVMALNDIGGTISVNHIMTLYT